jgi:glycosyltransferase involved in cell wall biosynthesis
LSRWLAQHVQDYDLVHIHAIFSYASIPAAFYAKRYGVPYIVRPLGVLNRWGVKNRRPWLKQLSFRFIEQRILANAAAIHYTSEQEQIEAEELGVTSRAIIIPNAVDDALLSSFCSAGRFRARYPQFADRLIILFLSRVDEKKGLDLLLPAFACIKNQLPESLLVIAGNGDPDFIGQLQQEARRLKIDKDIVWTGFLDGEEKRDAFADANLFVLPSYSENFGIAVIEAMACGLPVVISDQVGIHREIAVAQAGLVTSCEADALAEALLHLIGDTEKRKSMGKNGQRWVHQHCSSKTVTEKLLALYQQILQVPDDRRFRQTAGTSL